MSDGHCHRVLKNKNFERYDCDIKIEAFLCYRLTLASQTRAGWLSGTMIFRLGLTDGPDSIWEDYYLYVGWVMLSTIRIILPHKDHKILEVRLLSSTPSNFRELSFNPLPSFFWVTQLLVVSGKASDDVRTTSLNLNLILIKQLVRIHSSQLKATRSSNFFKHHWQTFESTSSLKKIEFQNRNPYLSARIQYYDKSQATLRWKVGFLFSAWFLHKTRIWDHDDDGFVIAKIPPKNSGGIGGICVFLHRWLMPLYFESSHGTPSAKVTR